MKKNLFFLSIAMLSVLFVGCKPKPTPEEPEEEEPKTNVPKTSDSTPIGMWILILLISGGSILLLVRKNEQK